MTSVTSDVKMAFSFEKEITEALSWTRYPTQQARYATKKHDIFLDETFFMINMELAEPPCIQ
jgi:hypothetical protein